MAETDEMTALRQELARLEQVLMLDANWRALSQLDQRETAGQPLQAVDGAKIRDALHQTLMDNRVYRARQALLQRVAEFGGQSRPGALPYGPPAPGTDGSPGPTHGDHDYPDQQTDRPEPAIAAAGQAAIEPAQAPNAESDLAFTTTSETAPAITQPGPKSGLQSAVPPSHIPSWTQQRARAKRPFADRIVLLDGSEHPQFRTRIKLKRSAAAATRTPGGDDLTALPGIDAERAQALNALGVTTFADIANWSDKELIRINELLSCETGLGAFSWRTAAHMATLDQARQPAPPSKPQPPAIESSPHQAEPEAATASHREARPKPQPDQLELIDGFSTVAASRLAAAGVTTFAQIAAWTQTEASHWNDALSDCARIPASGWIEQAALLAAHRKSWYAERILRGETASLVPMPPAEPARPSVPTWRNAATSIATKPEQTPPLSPAPAPAPSVTAAMPAIAAPAAHPPIHTADASTSDAVAVIAAPVRSPASGVLARLSPRPSDRADADSLFESSPGEQIEIVPPIPLPPAQPPPAPPQTASRLQPPAPGASPAATGEPPTTKGVDLTPVELETEPPPLPRAKPGSLLRRLSNAKETARFEPAGYAAYRDTVEEASVTIIRPDTDGEQPNQPPQPPPEDQRSGTVGRFLKALKGKST